MDNRNLRAVKTSKSLEFAHGKLVTTPVLTGNSQRKRMNLRTLTLLILGLIHAGAAAQPQRVDARLIAAPAPDGDGHILGVELSPEKGWHTYWRNSGDAGLPTRLRWDAPAGVSIGAVRWPTPHAYPEGDLMTYGYGDPHVLVNRARLDGGVADDAVIRVKARWLVCKDICIPESADLAITAGQIRQPPAGAGREIQQALQALPETLEVTGRIAADDTHVRAYLPLPAAWHADAEKLYWFPAAGKLIDHAAPVRWGRDEDGLLVSNRRHPDLEQLSPIEGVLTLSGEHGRRAVELRLEPGPIPADITLGQNSETGLNVWLALAMAFAGGLILNLMPCVFPVLTLKALSLTRAESNHQRRLESLAYTAGVLLSFLAFAGLLLALRAGGAALGWGFQLQNPVVVGALAVLMIILGLAMLGWTQIGMGLMGAGQNLTDDGGLKGAFFTGVLAVVVASPCSAPFMGGALGYAVLQPAPVALAIFAALGAGLAAPFVTIAWVPALAGRLPRPGPWMETLKHWMALPLFLTALWLGWVLWRQAGSLAVAMMAASALLIALGVHQTPRGWSLPRPLARLVQLAGIALLFSPLALDPQQRNDAGSGQWQAWSPERVEAARAEPRMVLVDFTADWCLSCIVNERAVLSSETVQDKLAAHDALLLKADWSQYDPRITAALAEHGRNGVPLYLLYPADGGEPEILPQILTKGLVTDAIDRAAQ